MQIRFFSSFWVRRDANAGDGDENAGNDGDENDGDGDENAGNNDGDENDGDGDENAGNDDGDENDGDGDENDRDGDENAGNENRGNEGPPPTIEAIWAEFLHRHSTNRTEHLKRGINAAKLAREQAQIKNAAAIQNDEEWIANMLGQFASSPEREENLRQMLQRFCHAIQERMLQNVKWRMAAYEDSLCDYVFASYRPSTNDPDTQAVLDYHNRMTSLRFERLCDGYAQLQIEDLQQKDQMRLELQLMLANGEEDEAALRSVLGDVPLQQQSLRKIADDMVLLAEAKAIAQEISEAMFPRLTPAEREQLETLPDNDD
jgi:hypothetical protein